MNRTITSLLTGAAMLAAAGAAQAAVISGGTASLTSTLTDYNLQLGSLNKFDSTLGTLQSISFTYSYGFNSQITINAQTTSTGSIRTESAAQFYATDVAIDAVLDNLINTTSAAIGASTLNPAAYDLLGTTRTYNITGGQSQTFTSNASVNTQTISSSQSGDLLPFVAFGGGTFAVFAQTLTGTLQSNTGGNNSANQSTLASQSVSVSYTYTEAPPVGVPEPASMALLGAGLFGLGLARRRKG